MSFNNFSAPLVLQDLFQTSQIMNTNDIKSVNIRDEFHSSKYEHNGSCAMLTGRHLLCTSLIASHTSMVIRKMKFIS